MLLQCYKPALRHTRDRQLENPFTRKTYGLFRGRDVVVVVTIEKETGTYNSISKGNVLQSQAAAQSRPIVVVVTSVDRQEQFTRTIENRYGQLIPVHDFVRFLKRSHEVGQAGVLSSPHH